MLLALILQASQDVLVLKDGTLAVGTITEIHDDGITFRGKDGSTRKYADAELDPYSAYEARRVRANPDDADARVRLGDFCMAQKLFRFAQREYQTAADLGAAGMEAKIAGAAAADASQKIEQAEALLAAEKYAEAAKALRYVLENYPALAQAAKAKQLLDGLTAKVEAEALKKEEQKKKAEEALEAAKDELAELRERTAMARAVKFIEDSKKYWADGLDREGEGNLKAADRTWKDAVERLNLAMAEFELLVESNDIEMIKQVKALRPEVNEWMVRAFTSLGQLHVNAGQLQEATLWVNQALKIAPDHDLARTLKLEITRALLRQKNP